MPALIIIGAGLIAVILANIHFPVALAVLLIGFAAAMHPALDDM